MAGRHRKRPPVWRRLLLASLAGAAIALGVTVMHTPGVVPQDAGAPAPAFPPVAMSIKLPTIAVPTLPPPTTTPAPTTTPPPPPPTTTTPKPKPPPPPAATSLGARIVASARTFFGIPYVWGGTSRAGLDCSGLVYLVMKANGISSPRTAATLAVWSRRITAAQAQPGDLVFWGSPAYHVAIYIGNGRVIDAHTYGTVVQERPLMAGAYFGRIP